MRPLRELLVSDEPWLADALPIFSEGGIDLHAIAEELQQQPLASFGAVTVNVPIWLHETAPDAGASAELGCLGALCPTLQWVPYGTHSNNSISVLLEHSSNVRVRAKQCDGVETLTSANGALSSRGPITCSVTGSHGVRNLTRALSNAIDIGTIWDVRPTAPGGPARGVDVVRVWSLDIYLTSGEDITEEEGGVLSEPRLAHGQNRYTPAHA